MPLWHEFQVRYVKKICGLWSGVLFSKSHELVRGQLTSLSGLTEGTSHLRGSSHPTTRCLSTLAFREPWSLHPALSWAGEALPVVGTWIFWETPCSGAPVNWSWDSSAMASRGCPARCHLYPWSFSRPGWINPIGDCLELGVGLETSLPSSLP